MSLGPRARRRFQVADDPLHAHFMSARHAVTVSQQLPLIHAWHELSSIVITHSCAAQTSSGLQ